MDSRIAPISESTSHTPHMGDNEPLSPQEIIKTSV